MSVELQELENLLSKELGLFKNILKLEENKQDAILNRDPNSMENFCREQEKVLKDINPLEESRQKITLNYNRVHPDKDLTLKGIVKAEGNENTSIVKTGKELGDTLYKIKLLQETNTRLIRDNLDLFSRMVNELKGYSDEEDAFGTRKPKPKQANPLLVNKKV